MEVEFKAKTITDYPEIGIKTGDWVYGDVSFGTDFGGIRTAWMLVTNEKGVWQLKVDPNTVCQYTGCKDKSGKKIYYHDFVKKRYWGGVTTQVVVFRWGAFGAATQSGSLTEVYTLNDKNIEVLGNVYDNPELFNSKYPHLPADA